MNCVTKGTFWLTLQNKLVFWKHLGKHFKSFSKCLIDNSYLQKNLVCRNSPWNTKEAIFFKGLLYMYALQISIMRWLIIKWTKATHNSESSVALETTHTHIIVHTGLCHQVKEWAYEFSIVDQRSNVLYHSHSNYIPKIGSWYSLLFDLFSNN